jgi:hypothetical protein
MKKTTKRNVIGSVVCFVLCALFGCFGLTVMMCREVAQSQDSQREIEKDDVVRYSFVGCAGYIVNVVLLVTLF